MQDRTEKSERKLVISSIVDGLTYRNQTIDNFLFVINNRRTKFFKTLQVGTCSRQHVSQAIVDVSVEAVSSNNFFAIREFGNSSILDLICRCLGSVMNLIHDSIPRAHLSYRIRQTCTKSLSETSNLQIPPRLYRLCALVVYQCIKNLIRVTKRIQLRLC